MSRGAAQDELVVSPRNRAAARGFLLEEACGFLDFIPHSRRSLPSIGDANSLSTKVLVRGNSI